MKLVSTRQSLMLSRRSVMQLLPHQTGYTDKEIADPNINPEYHESCLNLFPMKSRLNFTTPQLKALKNKEMGDWKKLSEDEVLQLYRGTFRYSIAEIFQSTDGWKTVFGATLWLLALSLFMHWVVHIYCLPPYHDGLTNPETIQKIVKRHLQEHQGAISGVSSRWDYENNRWK